MTLLSLLLLGALTLRPVVTWATRQMSWQDQVMMCLYLAGSLLVIAGAVYTGPLAPDTFVLEVVPP